MMKHLFASCAVVALMAAPAIAQTTTEPTDRYAAPAIEEPATQDPDVTADAQIQSDTDVIVAAEPETDEMAGQAVADAETDMASESGMVSGTEAELSDEATTVADDGSMFQTQMIDGEVISAPIEVAELPADYSTDDLNAMMLAQLNVDAEEIASTFDVEVQTFASDDTITTPTEATDTFAETETESAEPAEAESYASNETEVSPDASIETYASDETSTNMVPDEAPVMAETYASVEPVSPALEDDASMMDDETVEMAAADEAMTYSQPDGSMVSAEGDYDQNAVEIAEGDARFSTLVELVGIAGLEDELSSDGPYTVFAPTNEAFADLPEATLARLKTEEGKAELVEILKAHVVSGAVTANEVPLAGEEAETLADTSLNLMGSTDGSLNIGGTVHTVGDGIYASNGVVYAVDAVILPEAPQP